MRPICPRRARLEADMVLRCSNSNWEAKVGELRGEMLRRGLDGGVRAF
jgi:hypothetical protein